MRRKTVLRIGVSLVAAFLLLELALRLLISGTGDLGARFRRADLFARNGTDLFWALEGRFAGEANLPTYPDEELGWVSKHVVPGTYAHRDHERLRGRRPVLLYGDSFAACMTAPEECYQGLLLESDLADELFVLNHAVPGHGPGQMWLMMQRTLDRYAELDPLVIVGIYVDDDLQRAGLSLRQFPKPRFALEDGVLVHEPPVRGGREAWYAENTRGPTSYLWSLLVRRLGGAHDGRDGGLLAVNRAVLAGMARELETRGLEGFVVLMPGPYVLAGQWDMHWQEPFLRETLTELGLPFVNARRELEASEGGWRELFMQTGHGRNHYNPRGNRTVFNAMVRGLRREYDG